MIKLIKKIIKTLPIQFTLNQQYDFQTKQIIKKVCNAQSNCIDIGCHKGEVMEIILKTAKNGTHFGFEPIPALFSSIKQKYSGTNVQIIDIALSNLKGESTFNHVISNPAYSGLVKRKYDKKDEIDQQITVKTDLLDNIIPSKLKIDLIKIDVEGGELLVLEGAKKTIKNNKPIIIFEHGLGASEFYGATPEKVFYLLKDCGFKISTMKNWLEQKPAFTLEEFNKQFNDKINYYFIAFA